jgi:hypothetical protein
MATTTNYSWQTPDDTALVKDGASAIRTLGSSVDTTTKALNPSTTLGDIEYRSSTANTNTRLGIGTSGQVLTVSGGGVPSWATPAGGGGMTLISDTVASANSSISFSSLGSYKQLLLIWQGLEASGNGQFSLRFNNDSGTKYYLQSLIGNAAPYADFRSSDNVNVGWGMFGQSFTSTTRQNTSMGYILIDNYTSATLDKKFNGQTGWRDAQFATDTTVLFNGTFDDATAITSLDIVRLSGTATLSNAANTSIRLYGIS